MPNLLFLCTGNFYRSRFAEIVFNALAEAENSPWRADSRALNPSPFNIGPISQHCVEGLQKHGFVAPENPRMPARLTAEDFSEYDLTIAVKEAEHRPLMERFFPDWADRIEYWHVHDLDCATPEEALPELLAHVQALLDRLKKQPPAG